MNPGLTGFWQFLIVLAEPSAPAEAGQRAFNHPSARQHLELVAVRSPAHYLQQPSSSLPSPRHQPTGFRGPHRLAVDDGPAGSGIPSLALPDHGTQCLQNPLPSAVPAPFPEVPPDRAPRGKVVGHYSPGNTATQHVQDAVHHLPQVHGSRMSPERNRGQQGFQQAPLGIGQISGIRSSIHIPKLQTTRKPHPAVSMQVPTFVTHPLRTRHKRTPEQRKAYDKSRNQTPERKEFHRKNAQQTRLTAKALGLCRACRKPAIPDQTMCEVCAEKHRQRRRKSDAARRARQKAQRESQRQASAV